MLLSLLLKLLGVGSEAWHWEVGGGEQKPRNIAMVSNDTTIATKQCPSQASLDAQLHSTSGTVGFAMLSTIDYQTINLDVPALATWTARNANESADHVTRKNSGSKFKRQPHLFPRKSSKMI